MSHIDWNLVRSRFSGMTRDELLAEVALHVGEYEPLVQKILEGEALARGITAAQIEGRRGAETPAAVTDGIDRPALITSSDDKGAVLELARILQERGIAAAVRELDPKAFHASRHRVGRWGLMVAGPQAADAAHLLEPSLPLSDSEDAAGGCGGGCCSEGVECDPAVEEWPEDGDWWKTPLDEDEPKS